MDERITLKTFLEKVPPYRETEVSDLYIFDGDIELKMGNNYHNLPEIEIECPVCKGKRYFQKTDYLSERTILDETNTLGLIYTCKNCNEAQKIFNLKFIQIDEELTTKFVPGKILKIGEYPPFGDSIPAKVITLAGKEKDFFLKGRRCENQSLGIGAYAYYRRIVENQKNKLIDEIIKVCNKLGGQEELIKDLENAKTEIQFSKAIDSIKKELPTSLFIEDKNPLKLLHKAVSKGIHDMTDEECLKYAESIRVILFALTERINAILKDSQEIHDAISVLGSL